MGGPSQGRVQHPPTFSVTPITVPGGVHDIKARRLTCCDIFFCYQHRGNQLKNIKLKTQVLGPTRGTRAEVSVVPDAKTQFKINFRMVKPIDDEAVIKAIIDRSKDELQKAIDTAGAVNEMPTEEAATADNARF